jgi:ubiquinol-cytochrome c reductase cytochrome c1 subunit
MRKLARRLVALAGLIAGALAPSIAPSLAVAAEGAEHPPGQNWSFSGVFGTYDKSQLRRGLQVYRQVCSNCHSLHLVAYRNLAALGLKEKEIEAIAAEKELPGEPNDEGEATTRKALPSDRFVPPFANEKAARAANNGALPPDLSLMAKARLRGPDYIFALLTGFKETPPKGAKVPDGMYYNTYFPGHNIAMAPPLSDGGVEYTDKTKATLPQQARDIVAFLQWAADPYLEERKRMGVKVVLFLLFLTGLLYAYKRKVWAALH